MKKLMLTCALIFSTFIGIASANASECFDAHYVNSWDYDSEKNVLNVSVFGGEYEVGFSHNCSELTWAHTIGFKSFFSSQVCRGDKVVIFDSASSFNQFCLIKSVTKK